MDIITSRRNSKVKRARSLRQGKARREQGVFLVEGIRHVGEAVEAEAKIEAIFYSPDLLSSSFALDLIAAQEDAGVSCYPTSADVFNSLAEKENPQGILAIVKAGFDSLDQLTPVNFSWGVALISPQDPGNLGTILRTIDAVAADGILLIGDSVDPYHPSVVRASMGALFYKPIVNVTFNEFAHWARRYSYHVYGTSAHGSVDYRQVDYLSPKILLMGSEREGLKSEQITVCENLINLPMRGRVTSLNLAVATGIMLYAMIPD